MIQDTPAIVNLALQIQPDLLLIEHELPDVNGLQISKMIRSERLLASLPIMIISQDPTVEEIEACLNCGADNVVSAPFNDRVLLARIEAIFRRTHYAQLIEKPARRAG